MGALAIWLGAALLCWWLAAPAAAQAPDLAERAAELSAQVRDLGAGLRPLYRQEAALRGQQPAALKPRPRPAGRGRQEPRRTHREPPARKLPLKVPAPGRQAPSIDRRSLPMFMWCVWQGVEKAKLIELE